jgi:hypothetical protein
MNHDEKNPENKMTRAEDIIQAGKNARWNKKRRDARPATFADKEN